MGCIHVKNSHLTLNERIVISKLLSLGESYTYIADTLDRSITTIRNEVLKNVDSAGKYNPVKAQEKAHENQKVLRSRRKVDDTTLKIMYSLKKDGNSIRDISKLLKEKYDINLSYSTVYRYLNKKN